ncbi:Carboxypeptidase [Rhynchospora pubera]|uniref:Carboxypeptidase n=1 Tax=Rhynchospora pubera TaxID=906938 RepID=A0AAV8EC51_9POAL|nr:Carboxypeptidase [Rhynchospora pubera]
MANLSLLFFSLLFFSLASSSSSSSSILPDLKLPDFSRLPYSDAESLIRALNLFPKDATPQSSSNLPRLGENRIVEKKFKFPFLASDETSIEDLGHHAGYYSLNNKKDARMFYFFFESRNSTKDPVVIWLTGGPGCSSELALFYENGPFTISQNMSLAWNEYGWDQVSNLIYVDQPVGTGFSYSTDNGDTCHDENCVSTDLYNFLQAFFTQHPEYADNDFYITGESYAGHYIPAFAGRVHQGNKNNEGIHINLKGFAIGNGLTDPAIQFPAYTDYALDMGIITESQYKSINKFVSPCEFAIKLCGTSGKATCLAAYLVCNTIFSSIIRIAGKINYYDIRKECVGSLCYDFSNADKFLNLDSVREALGVGNIEFVSCSPTVYEALLTDYMRNLEVGIPSLLEDGISLLIYAGEYDLICNWVGNSRWVHSMEWSGQQGFNSSKELSFTVDGKEAGVLKSYGPLNFLKVHDAGHMVPMDQPKAALEMLRRWTRGDLVDKASDSMSLISEI